MSAKKPTLGGAVCVRDGDRLDYPWRECVRSLLPVCDEVVLCVGSGSADGTEDEARELASHEPKVRLCIYDWPNPKGDPDFWVKWLNYAREHITSDWHFQLDADEILHENSYDRIRSFIQHPGRSAVVTRYNFWRDHQNLIPEGVCLGKFVIRLAPKSWWMPSDGSHHMGAELVSRASRTGIEIMHYGFLRKRDAFFAKARALQSYFFDSYDPRLTAVQERLEILAGESKPGNWMSEVKDVDWINRLVPFEGTHPEVIKPWLKERGYA